MLYAWAQVPRLLLPRSWQPVRHANSAAGYSRDSNGTPVSEGQPLLRRRGLSAYIRMTRFIESPADAFAIIRAVERKYGALTEYRFYRDFEIGTKYQNSVHVVFRDPQSTLRLSADSGILHIPAPHIISDRPGGIGLDELEGLLERQEYIKEDGIPAFENVMESVLQSGRDEKNDRFIECKIKRSTFDFVTVSRPASPGQMRRILDLTARNFVHWGGFYDIKPIEKDTPIPNEDLFGTSHIDHVRMRRTIRKWSDIGGVPNPYEYTHDSKRDIEQDPQRTDDHAEWEPLPGYAASAEDIPVPMTSSVEVDSQPLTVPCAMSATPNNPILAPCSPAGPLKLPPPPPLPSDVRAQASSLTDIPTQNRSPSLENFGASSAVQSNKAIQLRAARDLVKRAQQQNLKKKNPANPLNSKPPAAQDRISIRHPIRPSETQNSTSTERLKGFFKTWF